MSTKIPAALCACLILGVAAVGCGGGSDSSSSSSGSSSAGTTASSGAKPTVPPQKIGVLNAAPTPADEAMESVVKETADALGWEVKAVDALGEPEQMSRGATALLQEGVDGLVAIAIEAPLIRNQLEEFKSKEIPTCSIGSGQPPTPLYSMQFLPEERKLGRMNGEYVGEKNPTAEIIALTNTSFLSGTEKFAGFKEGLEAKAPGAKIVAEPVINLADAVGSTTKSVESSLQAHPDASVVFSVFDAFIQPADAALTRVGSDAKVYSFYTSEPSTTELRDPKSPLSGLVDVSLTKSSALCMEQFLQHVVTGNPVETDAAEKNPFEYVTIGKEDVDKYIEPGQFFAFPPEEQTADFLAQWKKQYDLH